MVCNDYFRDEYGSEYTNTKQILDELGISNPSSDECKWVRSICQAVSERAAFLASAGKVNSSFLKLWRYRILMQCYAVNRACI